MAGVDTDLLRTFLAVARSASFTAAANELHLVQSTVTSRMQTLEHALGTRLFDRSPGGVRVTAAGQIAVGHAHAVLDAERRLVEAATPGDEVVGSVVVGAPESICAYRLPSVVAELRARYPKLRVHLVATGSADTVQGLRTRRLDLGLLLDDVQPPRGWSATEVGREEILLVAAPGHPAAAPPTTWAELGDYSYFLLEDGCTYSDRFLRDLDRNAPHARDVTRFGSIEAARSCVVAGLGLAALPRVACEAALARGELVVVALPLPDVPMVLVHDTDRWRSPAWAAVRETLATAAADW